MRFAWPTILRRQHSVDFTILSKTPPHQGARSMLKVHWLPWPSRCSCTASSLNTALTNLAAALNLLLLLETNFWGKPLLEANLFRHLIKVSVDKSDTISKWMTRVTKQKKRQIHSLLLLVAPSTRMKMGPAKSTPV